MIRHEITLREFVNSDTLYFVNYYESDYDKNDLFGEEFDVNRCENPNGITFYYFGIRSGEPRHCEEAQFLYRDLSSKVSHQLFHDLDYYLFILDVWEDYSAPEVFEQIHRYCKEKNVSPSKVIYGSGSIALYHDYEIFLKSNPVKEKIKLYFNPYWILYSFGNYSCESLEPLEERDYICLNRVWKDHRIIFLYLLDKYSLLDDGYVSFPDEDYSFMWDNIFDLVKQIHYFHREHIDISVFKKLPLVVDLPSLDYKVDDNDEFGNFENVNRMTDELVKFYEKSLIAIINETHIFNERSSCFITEKTWKTIIAKKPFMINGTKHSLRYLQLFGFKTFNEIFDERYDDYHAADGTRELMIIHNLYEFVHNPHKYDIVRSVDHIVQHNYERLCYLRDNKIMWIIE